MGRRRRVKYPAVGEAPPQANQCIVWVNPYYRTIFLRGTKVGGTSVQKTLGGECKRRAMKELTVRAPCCAAATILGRFSAVRRTRER